jgi:TRAP-type mannitol/chloroaromatic compound transport system substrate-binding protein
MRRRQRRTTKATRPPARRRLDAAEFNNPSSDLVLGFPDVAKCYMMQSNHQQCEAFEVIFNKRKFNALPAEIRSILKYAAFAATADQFGFAQGRYADDLAEIRNRGVQILKTPDSLLEAQLAAWDRVIAAQSDPFFKKVIESQKAWARRTVPYFLINNNTAALQAAYTHFFG